ncbi:HNH endonuclease [Leucobacter albus]|uniref:HNH endonuclease n=1 Tax=Leucobacter albus TaxID=272210 RepID=A0ABW3TIS5_9MICO
MDCIKYLKTVDIDLTTPTLDALSETLVQKSRSAKSTAGQRPFMTARLCGSIKDRSEPKNLQTLCWRCNRTKGAKIPA